MSIYLAMLAAFGIGYIIGFISRELQTLLYYTTVSMKARKQEAAKRAYDKAYDDAILEADEEERRSLPDDDAVSKDTPEQEDLDEEEKRKGIKTFFS